jgi:hypothetical protein
VVRAKYACVVSIGAALNSQIAQLQAFTQSNLNAGAGGKQVSEHNKNETCLPPAPAFKLDCVKACNWAI